MLFHEGWIEFQAEQKEAQTLAPVIFWNYGKLKGKHFSVQK